MKSLCDGEEAKEIVNDDNKWQKVIAAHSLRLLFDLCVGVRGNTFIFQTVCQDGWHHFVSQTHTHTLSRTVSGVMRGAG